MKTFLSNSKVAIAALLSFFLLSANTYAVFPDINVDTTMYYDAIVYLEGKDTVVGFSDGTFRPEANISRAEFTKIIVETRFTDEQIAACNEAVFPDVASTNPHFSHICVAHNNNVLHGYSDGEFKPDVNIMADQAAKIIVNSYGIGFGQTADTELALYVDQLQSRDAWPTTVENEKDMLQRAEMAQIIYRMEVKTSLQTLIDTDNFNSLEAALIQAQLESVLRGETEYTVFAPNNGAFAAVTLPGDDEGEELSNILLDHVVEGSYTMETLLTMDNQTLTTEGGAELLIDVNGEDIHIQDEAGNRAMIVNDGVMASNGIVFEIDMVLNWATE